MIISWYDTNTWCLIFVTSTLIQKMALLQAIIWSNLVIAITKDIIPKSYDGRMSSATALVKSNHHFHGNHWLHDVVVCTITLCSMAAIRHTGYIIILAPFLYKGVVLSVSEIPLWRSYDRISYRPRQNGHHFADDIFKCIFLNENVLISIKISLKFVPKGPINDIPALVKTIAWRRSGGKLLSEPMMVSLLTHICVTRPQWV